MKEDKSTISTIKADLSLTIAGVAFKNPIIAASGTFGYGREYSEVIDVSRLGGICSKGLTLEPRAGNSGRRILETPSGLMNSIGLENPGISYFIEHELPQMLELGPVVIANLSGSTLDTYVEGARLLNSSDVHMIELNISCPNVKAGGMAWGLEAKSAAMVTSAVRKVTDKPLIVKLSPNALSLVKVAQAVVNVGADALSLVNTFQGFALDITTGKPVFDNITAGFSGPAIKPLALRLVRDVLLGVPQCSTVKEHSSDLSKVSLPRGKIKNRFVPVIGLGGISCWQDAAEFLMTGASAVQIGTAIFANPHVIEDVISGLEEFCFEKQKTSVPGI